MTVSQPSSGASGIPRRLGAAPAAVSVHGRYGASGRGT